MAQSVPNVKMTVHDMVMLGRKPYMKWGVTEKDHEMVHEAMDKLKVSEYERTLFKSVKRGRTSESYAGKSSGTGAQSYCF